MNAIIHTAALAGVWGPADQYEQINIVATTNLLKACEKLSIGAFVYTSSPSVTFSGAAQCNIDEQAPYPTRWLCHYPRTKAIAEQHVLSSNHPEKLAACSLRPHLIWGPGDPHLIPRVIEKCRSGKLRRVGNGRNLIDTVHVEAAAEAHRMALERMLDRDQNASGRAYFITDGAPVECWDWITAILNSAGLEAPSRSISFRAAYRVGGILEVFYRLFRMSSEPPMTRFVAAQLGVDHYFNIAAARERLGYLPIRNREERFAELRDAN
jgi:2-alkyl-3-oxoalkanoate reductase